MGFMALLFALYASLFENLIDNRKPVFCHRLNGYWLDIGHRKDYEKANVDFSEGTIDAS
jgi:NDP-sugar pyrophosphorylase family protein